MALDASQLLGSPQLAGVKVSPKGYTMRVASRNAGVGVGGALGAAISATASTVSDDRQIKRKEGADAPDFGRAAYLAVTDTEVAVIKLKGFATFKLDEVIERVPRSDVASAEIREGIAPSLTIMFGNGQSWQFEFGRVSKKDARAVLRALGI
jgi:hypothetical protein